ncbi:MAG: helix-turn-helix domain-containing protein [Streptosporangiaceae bacterium]
MEESNTIGARLRQARRERGITQENLAERSAVSIGVIRMLEQETRTTARVVTLTSLANALGISLSDLLGRRERLGRDDGILRLRDALLAVDDLPGIDPVGDPDEVTPVTELAAAVERGWKQYWSGRLDDLTAMLPGLIGEARVTAREDCVEASASLTQAYQLAADLLAHVGSDDLAFAAAKRAMGAARAGNNELQYAAAAGTASWVLLRQARAAAAEHVARTAAAEIEPRLSDARAEHLTVWGSLLLQAAACAAARDDAGAVEDYITLTRMAARVTRDGEPLFGADRYDYQTNFGRTQVEMQACYTSALLGRESAALRAATRVRRSDLRPISWGAHNLDVARASLHTRRGDDAVAALSRAHAVSDVWFRHQVLARDLVREAMENERRVSPALRTLADAVGVR